MKNTFFFFCSLLKFHRGVSPKLVSPPRFFLTLTVGFGRANSIRRGPASGPTDAATRLQNSGDEIKQRCAVRNAINRPTRCRVCNAIKHPPGDPHPGSACDWDYKPSPPDEIKTRRLRQPHHEVICLRRLKQKKNIYNAMKWKSHLFNSFSPSFFGRKSY